MAAQKASPQQAGVRQTLGRIVRAYRNKIRRQLQAGSEFGFWQAVGGDEDVLREHISCFLQPGMKWSNYGEWQLVNTHELPKGGLRTARQFYQYFDYRNYRPRWKDPARAGKVPVLRNGVACRK